MKFLSKLIGCFLLVSNVATAGNSIADSPPPDSGQEIAALNNKIQTQLKTLQAQQQEQITTLNTQLQNQLKQMQTELQNQIQTVNKQTQDQMKQMQSTLQQQIVQVQQQIKH